MLAQENQEDTKRRKRKMLNKLRRIVGKFLPVSKMRHIQDMEATLTTLKEMKEIGRAHV